MAGIAPSSSAGWRRYLRLLSYARPYSHYLAAVLLSMATSVGLELLRPWPLKFLVDQALGRQPLPAALISAFSALRLPAPQNSLILFVCLATVLIVVGGAMVNAAGDFARVALGHRLAYRLGADLLLHLQRLSLRFHGQKRIADLASRVTDDCFCGQLLVLAILLPVLRSLTFMVGSFAVLWSLEPSIAALSLGLAPLLLLVIVAFQEQLKRPCRERRELEAQLSSAVQATLNALPAVQAFHRADFEQARYVGYARDTVAAHERAAFADSWLKIVSGLITSTAVALVIWVGAQHVRTGAMSAGAVLIVIAYVQGFFEPMRALVESFSSWQTMAVCAERVSEILDARPEVADAPGALDARLSGGVRFENVWFSYEDERPTLRGISLEAKPGETVAIVGPTGAGKTTLVSLLVRLHQPTAGRVTIDGYDVGKLRLKTLREQIAVVLQQPFIMAGSVAENIAYGKLDATRQEIIAAAVAANAHEFITKLPQGYDTLISDNGASLSGGEKQRLAIARAFIKKAPILLLDEPTSALDAQAEAALLQALARLREGRTTLVVAHRLSTVKNADQICVLRDGEVIEQGRHRELRASRGLYSELCRAQGDGFGNLTGAALSETACLPTGP